MGNGVHVVHGKLTKIEENLIGLSAEMWWPASIPNTGHGVQLGAGASNTRISGNINVGNWGDGVHGEDAVVNDILGNRIGVAPIDMDPVSEEHTARPNLGHGVYL